MILAMKRMIFCSLFIGGIATIQSLKFTQNPPPRISKSLGDNVKLKWTYSIPKPSELVRLECGYLNASRQMTTLMMQFSTDNQPRTTVTGTKFQNRAYIENGALVLTNLKSTDAGIYYCIIKAYDAGSFRTVTIRSTDSYLSIGGPKSGGRSGMSSATRTTIIVIIVIVVILVLVFFAYLYWRKRYRSKSKRTPLAYEDVDNEKNGTTNGTKNGKVKDTSRSSERRGLTAADIEIVSSPMEAVRKQNSETGYSSHKAYVTVEEDRDEEDHQRESWPEPPSHDNAKRRDGKSNPPNRAPPRVLPKPAAQKDVNEKTFL